MMRMLECLSLLRRNSSYSSGRSLGTATVVFEAAQAAKAAQQTYHGVTLDGLLVFVDLCFFLATLSIIFPVTASHWND